MANCYDCGILLSKSNKTKEHIPAQNLFQGYDHNYKLGRLTVPACKKCNAEYSKIDHEIRDAIGIMNHNNALQTELTEKAVRSIVRKNDWDKRFSFERAPLPSIQFEYDNFKKLHIKNFKGVFYNKFGIPLPKDYEIGVVSEGDTKNSETAFAQTFYNFVTENDEWMKSGHEDIFKYNVKAGKIGGGNILETNLISDASFIACVMVYHQKICPVVFAIKTELIDQLEKEKQP